MSDKNVNFAPKNIRQIGVTLPNDKIYIEDYVMTYIKQISDVLNEEERVLVFVGYSENSGEEKFVCISGVVELIGDDKIDSYKELASGDNLKKLTRIKEDYYGELDFIGLCIVSQNELIKIPNDLYMYFQDGIMGDVLLVRDEMNEERIFRYQNGFVKQRGYYIYYERNESMQNYMLCMKDGKSIEYGYSPSEIIDRRIDEKIRSFSIPKNAVYSVKGDPYEKHKTIVENRWNKKWKYAVTSFLAIATLTVGVIKVDMLGKITREKAEKLVEESNEVVNEKVESLEVKTVAGDLVMEESEVNKTLNEEHGQMDDNMVTKEITVQEGKGTDENYNTDADTSKSDIKKVKNERSNGDVAVIKEANKYYVVKKGDALVDISRRMYGTHKKVSIIKKANGIENEDKIFIGQRLIIP